MAHCVTTGVEGWEFKRPKRTGTIQPRSLEWYCPGCRRWTVWPHDYKPPARLAKQFKWRPAESEPAETGASSYA